MANERYYQGPYYDSLGINYAVGTGVFTIRGAQGRDLSSANPGYVVLPSKTTPGNFVKYKVTANQSFIDDNGASEIIGNLFGFTTSVAITVDVPFFIYAVANDAETAIAFMISRHPHRTISPVAAQIGAPDDAVANSEEDFWSIDNIDETLYDENPCMCVGSFRMRMSSSDDWTVQTLAITDGVGQFQETTVFTQPLGQFGANSGTLTIANGGTAATFSTTGSDYWIQKNGYVYYSIFLSGDGGTAGAGAVTALFSTPFERSVTNVNTENFCIVVYGAGNTLTASIRLGASNTAELHVTSKSANGILNWADFSAGARAVTGTLFYKLQGS